MCSMKEELRVVKARQLQITNRITALEIELKDLSAEKPHVDALVDMWEKRMYDPITEERRVTSQLLNIPDILDTPGIKEVNLQKTVGEVEPSKTTNLVGDKAKTRRKPLSPTGLIMKNMLEIFYDASQGVTRTELGRQLDAKLGYHVSSNSLGFNLDKLKDATDSEKVVKYNKVWVLNEYLKDLEGKAITSN